jgi:hypothetical protein
MTLKVVDQSIGERGEALLAQLDVVIERIASSIRWHCALCEGLPEPVIM